jgi:hypothetical protein
MADNTEEDHLKNPMHDQSEIPPDEALVTVEKETINSNQATENMEVHKHPHHITHKKKWAEYLLEFFMLFLAVFLGFVAENIREHKVEREREKEYIESLIADLKNDQQVLAQHILHVKSGLSMTDSMVILLSSPSKITDNTGQLYYFARLAPRLKPLAINNRTLEQLKNSGNFRLIKNLVASNKIMNYYEKLPLVHLLESINETEFTEYKKIAAKIFDPNVFLQMEDENGDIKKIDGRPLLRNPDNELLQELSAFSVYMHGTKKTVMNTDNALKVEGAELMEYLRSEYHLE